MTDQHWGRRVKTGDFLTPIPLWNQTSRETVQLPESCKILAIREASCGSGFLFEVHTINGGSIWLDADWFENPRKADLKSIL